MQNCNAGIDHITIAPNGKFYICPAFYYDDVNNSVGDIKSGLNIKNSQLLELNHAPICKICDAYHCKRCVWLNKKITLEINTPSHQQCVLSHAEREVSRILLSDLHNTSNFNDFNKITPIPKIDYNDPIMIVTGEYKGAVKNNFPDENDDFMRLKQINQMQDKKDINPELLSSKDLLIEIYKLQVEILKELKK